MNHWVSKYTLSEEVCAACSEPIPNAGGNRNVQVTGRCEGAPELEGDLTVLCGACLAKPPWLGKYQPSVFDEHFFPHEGFCQQCKRFVGDGGYLALPPSAIPVKLGPKTRGALWGIWATHPSLAPRWVPHEDPLLDCPKPFGSKGDADTHIAELCVHIAGLELEHEADNWTFEAKPLGDPS